MLDMIKTLVDKGHAYVTDDWVVYFSVESFEDYGKLSNNTLAGLQSQEMDQADEIANQRQIELICNDFEERW